MRTPGNDFELAAGFCFTEGPARRCPRHRRALLRRRPGDRQRVQRRHRRDRRTRSGSDAAAGDDVVELRAVRPRSARRPDGCAWCRSPPSQPRSPVDVLAAMPATVLGGQGLFGATGAVHAAAAFDAEGPVVLTREDVGRHNAVDKVVGAMLLDGRLPASLRRRTIGLFVSGRASIEMVQKAWAAGFRALVAVSAPTSLAVEAARRANLTLVGFVRRRRLQRLQPVQRVEWQREVRRSRRRRAAARRRRSTTCATRTSSSSGCPVVACRSPPRSPPPSTPHSTSSSCASSGRPGHEELGMGAIGEGDVRVLNDDIVATVGASPAQLDRRRGGRAGGARAPGAAVPRRPSTARSQRQDGDRRRRRHRHGVDRHRRAPGRPRPRRGAHGAGDAGGAARHRTARRPVRRRVRRPRHAAVVLGGRAVLRRLRPDDRQRSDRLPRRVAVSTASLAWRHASRDRPRCPAPVLHARTARRSGGRRGGGEGGDVRRCPGCRRLDPRAQGGRGRDGAASATGPCCAPLQSGLQAAGLRVVDSYVSLTEVSEYAKGMPEHLLNERLYPHAAAGRQGRVLLLPDDQAPRPHRQLVRHPVRRAPGDDVRARPQRAALSPARSSS